MGGGNGRHFHFPGKSARPPQTVLVESARACRAWAGVGETTGSAPRRVPHSAGARAADRAPPAPRPVGPLSPLQQAHAALSGCPPVGCVGAEARSRGAAGRSRTSSAAARPV